MQSSTGRRSPAEYFVKPKLERKLGTKLEWSDDLLNPITGIQYEVKDISKSYDYIEPSGIVRIDKTSMDRHWREYGDKCVLVTVYGLKKVFTASLKDAMGVAYLEEGNDLGRVHYCVPLRVFQEMKFQ